MEAKSRAFNFVRDLQNFCIPFFQRGYEWTEDRWEALLQTMTDKEFSHFLGSFIVKRMPNELGEPQSVVLIDGQQRMTTLSILLKALYDLSSDESKNVIQSTCEEIWFYRKRATKSEKFLKLTHSHLDRPSFEQIIKMQMPSEEFLKSIKKESHLILRCYKYFYNKLQTYTVEDREMLLDLMLSPSAAILIVIEVGANEDEQTIFRTINSEGSPLRVADIVKNDLFNRIKHLMHKSGEDNDQVEEKLINLYKQTWGKTFLHDEETDRFWKKERATGRMKRDNLSILLHVYAIIKQFYPHNKASIDQLNRYYKNERLDKLTNLSSAEQFLDEICQYAKKYREYISLSVDKGCYYEYGNSYEQTLQRVSHILKVLDISTLDPFIVYVMKDVDDLHKVEYLQLLERFIMRQLLAKESTKNYNKDVVTFIQDVDKLKNASLAIMDKQIFDGIKSLNNSNAELVLFWLELYMRSQSNKFTVKGLPYGYSVEHILPRTWSEEAWPLADFETIAIRDERKLYLGNLTLLTQNLNSSISNKSFDIKMKGTKNSHGIKYYAQDVVLNQEKFLIDYDKGVLTSWNSKHIEERTQYLYEVILSVWGDRKEL